MEYLLRDLYQRITALEQEVALLKGTRGASFELARVVTYIGGATCTVQYPNYAAGQNPASATLTGPTRVVPFQAGYTPAPGHNDLIINSPAWSGAMFPITAF